jgi:hypothetical protein
VALDYESEFANLIVNHNLSYETVTLQGGGGIVAVAEHSNDKKRITAHSSRKISQKMTIF